MMLDHESGAQRRASSVTVPPARGRASLEDCGLALGLSERGRLSARLRAIFFLLLGLRPSLRALAGPFGAPPPGQSVLKAHCRVGSSWRTSPAWGRRRACNGVLALR